MNKIVSSANPQNISDNDTAEGEEEDAEIEDVLDVDTGSEEEDEAESVNWFR